MYRVAYPIALILLAFAIPGGKADDSKYHVSQFLSQSDAAMILAFATVGELPPAPKPEPKPPAPKPDGEAPAEVPVQ